MPKLVNWPSEFGVVELELLYKCGFKYYLYKTLELSYKTPPELEDDTKTFGLLIHEAFKDTLKPKINENIKIEFSNQIIQNFKSKLEDIKLNEKIKNLFLSKIDYIKSCIEDILKVYEGIKIKGVEGEIYGEIEGLKIKGRYDLWLDGIVIDIKTSRGSILQKNSIENGNIQLPVYAILLNLERADIWHLNYSSYKNEEKLIESIGVNNKDDRINVKRITMNEAKEIAIKIIKEIKQIIENNMDLLKAYAKNQNICYVCELKNICNKGRSL
ncbi:MAG: PD-(D/E)XK nuclease family protein [bacterium]|nr:PD-(D/E)XK nuclease family protein [bacterium]